MVSLKFLTGQETHIISYIANKNRRHLGDDFLLEQCRYPINQAIHYRCGHAIDDDWAGNREHLGCGAEDKPLCCCQVRTHWFAKIFTLFGRRGIIKQRS